MKFSQLRPYSIGVVAENKSITDGKGGFNMMVEITVTEENAMLDGELDSKSTEETVDTTDADGASSSIKVESKTTIMAAWLPLGVSNRLTAPDVRRGAEVLVYRFADTDQFFWATLKDDLALRKLETVVYAWSATKSEDAPVNADNYYFLEISTHKQVVHFHTSKANGEFCVYDIQINTKDGLIKIQDDIGNFITFDSKDHQIILQNVDGTSFDLDKKNLTITVPETYKLVAKNVVEEISEAQSTKAGKSISTETKDHTTKADSLTEQASNVKVNGSSSVKVQSGAITLTGPTSIN